MIETTRTRNKGLDFTFMKHINKVMETKRIAQEEEVKQKRAFNNTMYFAIIIMFLLIVYLYEFQKIINIMID